MQTTIRDASQSFTGTRTEIIILIAAIIAIVIGAAVFFVVQMRSSRKEAEAEDRNKFNAAVERHGLDQDDIAFIKRLLPYLQRQNTVHLLVTNQTVFARCVQKLALKEDLPQKRVGRLRLKLGFGPREEGKPISSTTEIPDNQELTVDSDKFNAFEGVVTGRTPDFLIIRRKEGNFLPGIGSEIVLNFQRKEGHYMLNTTVETIEEHAVGIPHSENVKMTQYRKFFRKNLNTEIGIRIGGSNVNYTKTLLIELSGGGASVQNPKKMFRKGEDVELYIRDQPPLKLLGEVIRLSSDGDVLHLSFPVLKPALRDRLIGYLMRH
jgi:hypothetical protein